MAAACCVHTGLSSVFGLWSGSSGSLSDTHSSPPLLLPSPPLPLQLLNSSSPLFTNRGTTMLWDKLCWLLALLALSSEGLPTPNDPLSSPRIFLSFKGKPHDGDVATHYARRVATLAPLRFLFSATQWLGFIMMVVCVSKSYGGNCCCAVMLNTRLQTLANCAPPDQRRKAEIHCLRSCSVSILHNNLLI